MVKLALSQIEVGLREPWDAHSDLKPIQGIEQINALSSSSVSKKENHGFDLDVIGLI